MWFNIKKLRRKNVFIIYHKDSMRNTQFDYRIWSKNQLYFQIEGSHFILFQWVPRYLKSLEKILKNCVTNQEQTLWNMSKKLLSAVNALIRRVITIFKPTNFEIEQNKECRSLQNIRYRKQDNASTMNDQISVIVLPYIIRITEQIEKLLKKYSQNCLSNLFTNITDSTFTNNKL